MSEAKTEIDRDTWETPSFLFNWLNAYFKFDIDLAASAENAKCKRFLTEEDDALSVKWHRLGRVGFCNPPYSNINPWVDWAIEEAKSGFITVMTIPTTNGEERQRRILEHGRSIPIIGRISFVAAFDYVVPGKNGKKDKVIKKGEEIDGNNKGTQVVIFGLKTRSYYSFLNYCEVAENGNVYLCRDKMRG